MPHPAAEQKPRTDYPSPSTESVHGSEREDHSPDTSFESCDKTNKGRGPGGGLHTGQEAASLEEGDAEEGDAEEDQSQVYRVLEIIRACAHGRPLPLHDDEASEWLQFRLKSSQYRRLLRLLELDGVLGYFEDQVRHDYDPRSGLLIFRLMTSAIHDVFMRKLSTKITNWILELQSDRKLHTLVTRAVSNLEDLSTTTVDLDVEVHTDSKKDTATCRKSPDGQYRYAGYKYAPFVVEVAYSHKLNKDKKDLPGLAKQYYEDSNGRIKTVLTVDLEYTPKQKRKARVRQQHAQATQRQTRSSSRNQASYKPTSTAAFSFYRGPERIISNQLFRDQAGELVQSDGLTLLITDFLPDDVVERLSQVLQQEEQNVWDQPSLSLRLTSQELFGYLVRSEVFQDDMDRSRTTSPVKDVEPATKPSGQKRRVNWADNEEEVEENDPSEEDVALERPTRRSRSASSKRRRLSSDRVYSGPTTRGLPAQHMAMRSHSYVE